VPRALRSGGSGFAAQGSGHALAPVHLVAPSLNAQKNLVRACASSPEIPWGGHGHGALPKTHRLGPGLRSCCCCCCCSDCCCYFYFCLLFKCKYNTPRHGTHHAHAHAPRTTHHAMRYTILPYTIYDPIRNAHAQCATTHSTRHSSNNSSTTHHTPHTTAGVIIPKGTMDLGSATRCCNSQPIS
jgi:hypothetical protein